MLPIASDLAVNAVRDHAASALPIAAIVPDEPVRESRSRILSAAFPRPSAPPRVRLVNRIDPCSGGGSCIPDRTVTRSA